MCTGRTISDIGYRGAPGSTRSEIHSVPSQPSTYPNTVRFWGCLYMTALSMKVESNPSFMSPQLVVMAG